MQSQDSDKTGSSMLRFMAAIYRQNNIRVTNLPTSKQAGLIIWWTKQADGTMSLWLLPPKIDAVVMEVIDPGRLNRSRNVGDIQHDVGVTIGPP
jgi:hypothetical protein